MIRALIFDFDGLILDTEGPEYLAWCEIFRAHAQDLPLPVWAECIGRAAGWFDPLEYLERLLGTCLLHIRRATQRNGEVGIEGQQQHAQRACALRL